MIRKRDALERIEKDARIREIRRKEQLTALNEYIGFAVTKLSGFAAVIVGAIELANPAFRPITLMPPESVVAFGLALLTGPKIIDILSTVLNSLKHHS